MQMELIKRSEVLRDIEDCYAIDEFPASTVLRQLKMDVKNIFPVDAVPVVRCKDCKHYHKDFESRHFCWRTDSYSWASNDFCAYGERKDGKDEA